MRAIELVRALQVIADSCQAVRLGRSHQLIPLAGQLRALLTDDGKKSHAPLLIDLADQLGQTLNVFMAPDTADPHLPEILRKADLHISGFPITPYRSSLNQKAVSIKQLLDAPMLRYKGNDYTAKSVIKWFANWTGGAHYSKLLPADFSELLTINTIGFQPLTAALLQIGESTLSIGRDLLRRLVDFEVHCVIAVPVLPQEPSVLFDSAYPGSQMRWTLRIEKDGGITFVLVGAQGMSCHVSSDRVLDWSRPRYICIRILIGDDLTTLIDLSVDGMRQGKVIFPEPIFVSSDQLHYDTNLNKTFDGCPQKFAFALLEYRIMIGEVHPGEWAKWLHRAESYLASEDTGCTFFEAESFGHKQPGQRDLVNTGAVRYMLLRDVLGPVTE